MSDDLVAFLNARLDEDEAAAMKATGTAWAWEATGDKDNSWAVGHVEDEDGRPLSGEIEHGQGIVIDGVCESINGNLADAALVARHDPARALREVATKRALLDGYETAALNPYDLPEGVHDGRDDSERLRDEAMLDVMDTVIRAVAAVYSDHPDYRSAWKP